MNVIELLGWSATATSILGAALVSFKRVMGGLVGYSCANVLWIAWAIATKSWQPLVTFSVFLVLSLYGIWNHRRGTGTR